jgi:hypothetical protein
LGWDALPKGVEDFVENFMFFEGAGSSIVRPLPFGRCHVDPCAHATHMPVTDDTVSYGKKPPPVFEGGGGETEWEISLHLWSNFWTLWLNRNDLVFNSKIISTLRALIFKLISFLQHWVIAMTGPDRGGGS